MKKRQRNSATIIRFRQWSRKGYAVFSGLNKVISIGRVNASVCDKALLKTNLITEALTERFSLTFNTGEREKDAEPEELLQRLLININTIQITDGTPAGCDKTYNIIKSQGWNGAKKAPFQPFFLFKTK